MVILGPVKTEKSLEVVKNGRFVFLVLPDATKHEIKEEIENLFSVNVVNVNVVRIKGEKKRVKRYIRHEPDKKKAIISLKEGQTIPLFETEKKSAKGAQLRPASGRKGK